MIGLLVVALALPAAVKLVGMSQENRGKASIDAPCNVCTDDSCNAKCITIERPPGCSRNFNECRSDDDCKKNCRCADPAGKNGDKICVDNAVRICSGGHWVVKEDCGAKQCSNGKCVSSRPPTTIPTQRQIPTPTKALTPTPVGSCGEKNQACCSGQKCHWWLTCVNNRCITESICPLPSCYDEKNNKCFDECVALFDNSGRPLYCVDGKWVKESDHRWKQKCLDDVSRRCETVAPMCKIAGGFANFICCSAKGCCYHSAPLAPETIPANFQDFGWQDRLAVSEECRKTCEGSLPSALATTVTSTPINIVYDVCTRETRWRRCVANYFETCNHGSGIRKCHKEGVCESDGPVDGSACSWGAKSYCESCSNVVPTISPTPTSAFGCFNSGERCSKNADCCSGFCNITPFFSLCE